MMGPFLSKITYMDREGAKLIQTLYQRTDNFPKMIPVTGATLFSSFLLVVFLLKYLFPKKRKPLVSESDQNDLISEVSESSEQEKEDSTKAA